MSFDECFSSETSFAGYEFDDLAKTHGMRLFIRNMGNGVVRASSPLLMPKRVTMRAIEFPDIIRLPERAPDAVRDLTAQCLAAMGVLGAERIGVAAIADFMRVIDDHTVEVLGWVQSLAMMV